MSKQDIPMTIAAAILTAIVVYGAYTIGYRHGLANRPVYQAPPDFRQLENQGGTLDAQEKTP